MKSVKDGKVFDEVKWFGRDEEDGGERERKMGKGVFVNDVFSFFKGYGPSELVSKGVFINDVLG